MCVWVCVCVVRIVCVHMAFVAVKSRQGNSVSPQLVLTWDQTSFLTWICDHFLVATLPLLGSMISLVSGRCLLPLPCESDKE